RSCSTSPRVARRGASSAGCGTRSGRRSTSATTAPATSWSPTRATALGCSVTVMRLDPAEISELPLPAGLFDSSGALVASTPEWRGPLPGSVSFFTGAGHLVVGATTPTEPELEALMTELLRAIRSALPAMDHAAALRTAVLLAGLELVSGR